MALTKEVYETLLSEVKTYLNITWEEETTNNKIGGFILSSVSRLNDIVGFEIDFSLKTTNLQELSISQIAKQLLLSRCFYLNEKALDDFEKNFRGELLTLAYKGKIYARGKE